MKRAALLIGVSSTRAPQLQKLEAVESSVADMKNWAQSQGFDHVLVRTDKEAPVRVAQIQEDIDELLKEPLDQLFVYFSGHGVNIGYSEYWLLSLAPRFAQEAVNVKGSAELARRSKVPHVVFISDACRTSASGIQAQNITGAGIFPNEGANGQSNAVDLFFATAVGDPALEIPLKERGYEALYTKVLVGGLSCDVSACTEVKEIAGKQVIWVRPWPLRHYLDKEVPARLMAASVSVTLSQIPDAQINSPPDTTWLARKEIEGGERPVPSPSNLPKSPLPDAVSLWKFRSEVGLETERPFSGSGQNRQVAEWDVKVGAELKAEAERLAYPIESSGFSSGCEFRVDGDTLFAEIFHPTVPKGLEAGASAWVEITKPVSVVLRFDNKTGLVLPAIPGFVVGLKVYNNALINVVYEPLAGSERWGEYEDKIEEIRMLRANVAAATRRGIFEPRGDGISALAEQMKLRKGVDPTMALYAAYAFNRIQREDRIIDMEKYLFEGLQLRFFDLALLGDTIQKPPDFRGWGYYEQFLEAKLMPATPLLSQGWALLSARNIHLPRSLADLRNHLTESLWSTFTSPGVDMLATALEIQEIPQ